jgi:transposase
MYVATVPNRASPPAILLREGYREGKKVNTRTLANITHWPAQRVEALRRCLKGEFDGVGTESEPVSDRIFAVLFVLKELAQRLGIAPALGTKPLAKLALFLILARVAHQGSRLSAVRWAEEHAVAEVLGIAKFDEDDLYDALDWLAENQEKIENKLYRTYVNKVGKPPVLVLYDVTSSYLEGEQNELAEYGHNRDGKNGKKQIVIGLLTADDGEPLAVKVFKGNTADPVTVADQVEILKNRFKIEEVVFVGDRGMVKSKGKAALTDKRLKYITALTDPQVRKLLKKDVIQADLFEETAQEVEYGDLRLVLRRNEAVLRKEANRRRDKLEKLQQLVEARNEFVKGSQRADPQAGLRKLSAWTKSHKLSSFVTLFVEQRRLSVVMDDEKQADAALLDGCYVIETDVAKEKMGAVTVDQRYRDLQKVERNFRNMKTFLLEVRPIYVRKKSRTIGHVFAVMLALKLCRELEACLKQAFGTTEEGDNALTIKDALLSLSRMCFQRHETAGQEFLKLPRPDEKQEAIFKALGVLPPRSRVQKPAHL